MHNLISDSVNDGFCSYEPHDCQDIDTTWSGVYHVTPLGTFAGFDVYCDMVTDGGGWLVRKYFFFCLLPFSVCY